MRGVKIKVTNESTSTNVSVTIDPNEHGTGDYQGGGGVSNSQYEKMKFGMIYWLKRTKTRYKLYFVFVKQY